MEANPPTMTIDISEAWQECDEKGQNLQNREPQIAKCRRKGGDGGTQRCLKQKNLSPGGVHPNTRER